ncbi:hypothetical protein BX600DRAFT_475585 [Xylariales sp. PMI_506]|nr:hypothetical protein BX600DRAFT_475585 [Xylariales sp. PMI_506]
MANLPIQPWKVEAATEGDIPDLIEAYINSFTTPFICSIFPPSDGLRTWYTTTFKMCILPQDGSTPKSRVVLIRKANGELISFAIYRILDMQNEEASKSWRSRWASAEGNPDLVDEKLDSFFGTMEKAHKHLIGDRKHVFLEVLGTVQKEQKQGCASTLIKWGTEWADELGLESYLDASAMGKPLYEKFGYAVQDVSSLPERSPAVPMIRPVSS